MFTDWSAIQRGAILRIHLQNTAKRRSNFLLFYMWMCFLPPRQRMFCKVPHPRFALKSKSLE
jgi:hypothetical protein